MAAGVWRFTWVDPQTDERFDLPCIDERKFSFKINQPGTAELTIPLRSKVGRYIATGSGWGYVLIYRGNTLMAVHETVSTDVGPASSEGVPSIGIVTTESAYAKAAAAIVDHVPFTIPSSALNAGLALGDLVLATPAWGIGEAALNGTNVTSINPSTFEQGMDLLTLIQTLAFRGSGFMFKFNAPSSFTLNGGNTVVGLLNCFNLSGDNTLHDYRWEYGEGTKANLAGYSWKRLGGEHLANVAYVPSLGDSEGNANGTKVAVDLTSIGIYGTRSRWISPDMPDGTLRQQLANDHVAYRKAPRRVLTITPNMDDGSGRVPTAMVGSFQPGAMMPVVIKDEGTTIVSGTVMVYSINITLDKDGKETVELETSQDT